MKFVCVCVSVILCVHASARRGSRVNRMFGWSSKVRGFGKRIETPPYLTVPACPCLCLSVLSSITTPFLADGEKKKNLIKSTQ